MTENIELPYQSETFKAAWDEWMQYRKERKLPKYIPTGLKKTFTMLLRISANSEQKAIEIINQSIELNYQGLFPLKENYATTTGTAAKVVKLGTSAARIEALSNWGK